MIDDEGASPLTKLVASLSMTPSPRVSLWKLIAAAYRTASARVMAVLAVVLGGGLIAGGVAQDSAVTSIVLIVVGAPIASVLAGAPAVEVIRMRVALSRESVVEGVVVAVDVIERRGSQTLEALRNGFVTGRIRVGTGPTTWLTAFELDTPWGQRVSAGDRLLGLADPQARRVSTWFGRLTGPSPDVPGPAGANGK